MLGVTSEHRTFVPARATGVPCWIFFPGDLKLFCPPQIVAYVWIRQFRPPRHGGIMRTRAGSRCLKTGRDRFPMGIRGGEVVLQLLLAGSSCVDAFIFPSTSNIGYFSKSITPVSQSRCHCSAPRIRMAASLQRTARDMRYNKLGNSDLLVSEVCLGTMTWGKQNSEEDAIMQMNLAFDQYGVNFFDTAEGYPIPLQPETQGETDRIIGRWLACRPRNKVILATKVRRIVHALASSI
jgi:hypothetical protein